MTLVSQLRGEGKGMTLLSQLTVHLHHTQPSTPVNHLHNHSGNKQLS